MAAVDEAPSKKAKVGEIQSFIDAVNLEYEKVHVSYEEQFWGTKMGLKDGDFSTTLLSSTKEAMEEFLRSPENKAKAEAFLASGEATASQAKTLDCFVRTFGCYQMSDEAAVSLRAECTKIEDLLNANRNTMALGYTPPGGAFVEKSSVGLRTVMKTHDDEATRKAAW